MFAYCGNNPVNAYDPTGYRPIWEHDYENDVTGYTDTGTGYGSIMYDVPMYRQRSLNLCWAFCQVMEMSFSKGITLTQEHAVAEAVFIAMVYHESSKKGSWNNGGWPLNRGESVNVSSIQDVYYALKSNAGPVYAYYDKEGPGAHLVIVTGVSCTKDIIYTNNPQGFKGAQSYSEFISGFAISIGTKSAYPLVCLYLVNN